MRRRICADAQHWSAAWARSTSRTASRIGSRPRLIFASSNHAVGFTPRSAFPVPDYAFPAPDTHYGVSKAAVEALAAMYHHRHGLDAICVRILSCFPEPRNTRMLSTWLSPDDAGRLFEACLTTERPGFRVIFGVSANTRGGWVSLAEANALGYQPRDERLRERLAGGFHLLRTTFMRFAADGAADAGLQPPPDASEQLQFANVMLGLGIGLAMLKLTEPDTVPASLLGAVLSVLIRTTESSAEARALLADPDARRASAV